MKTRRKPTVRAIFLYLLATVGIWTFLYACTNSYNRLFSEKIAPASLTVNADSAELSILDTTYTIELDRLSPDSVIYYVAYLLSPDELRYGIWTAIITG